MRRFSLRLTKACLATSTFLCTAPVTAQPYLSNLQAGAADPLFATYAAPLSRSQFVIDEGYHFRFYNSDVGIDFTTDTAGSLGLAFKKDGEVRYTGGSMHAPPTVTASYSDLVRYHYEPFPGVRVDAHFQVYSSRLAFQDVRVTNGTGTSVVLHLYPFIEGDLDGVGVDGHAFTFHHAEEPDNWTRSHGVPYVSRLQNVYLLSEEPDAYGAYKAKIRGDSVVRNFFADLDKAALDRQIPPDSIHVAAFHKSVQLAPGGSRRLRIVRGVADGGSDPSALRAQAEALLGYDIDAALSENEEVYATIPALGFDDPADELTYLSAFSLMRQLMLPPEGESSYNYFVFSREPTWGWGHGGQVFHESLTMLAYVFMDPEGAMDSQRVYMERQHDDGYINYRTGSYLNEIILHEGERTSSAPWYNWINWELYRVTHDRSFLKDAYVSGSAFYDWWMRNRDMDGDGLAEWGGHAVLESVRDSKVAVWDEVAWPSNFEAVDLNSMLVKEARSLASMAEALGDSTEAARWSRAAHERARRINATFWDEETGFYYHVDREDHDFTFEKPDDLRRREIIGLLPLWAGIATAEQAKRLVGHVTDDHTFHRPFGIPSLAADDPYYDPLGYWNGPVWVEWQYLIFRGLLDYGYAEEAADLADRVIANVMHHLRDSHTFWELYSPDANVAGHHQTYIWTGLIARMMIDLAEPSSIE